MRYLGSKRCIKEEILGVIDIAKEIMQTENYYEPFIGGCNIIPYVNIANRYGSDYCEGLVEFIKYIRENGVESLPDIIS